MKELWEKVFTKPVVEGLKEISRWAVFAGLSWAITSTLAQLSLVPETADVKLWVFTYTLPVRLGFQTGLTLLGRWVDKFMFVKSEVKIEESPKKAAAEMQPQGLLPF